VRIVTLATCLLLAACSPQPAVQKGTVSELDGAFGFDTLHVVNDAGETLVFDVYLATNTTQQQRGLMFIRQMPETTGMLFVYDEVDYHSMWMKNTYIPLDMVFAREDGAVASIIRDTVPQTMNSNASTEPVRYVLELNGGTTRRFGIGTRSRLLWGQDAQ